MNHIPLCWGISKGLGDAAPGDFVPDRLGWYLAGLVEQGRYGHPMRKATWLYAYGLPELPALRWGRKNDNELGQFKWGSRLYMPEHDRNRPRVDALHSLTPDDFRDALIAMAESANQRAAA